MLRRLLKIFAWAFAALVVVLAIALTVVYVKSNARLRQQIVVEAKPIEVGPTPEIIARGKHLASSRGCIDCHGQDFGGNKVIDDPMAGLFHGPNLTRGRGGLPADYSDMDYIRAIRHGVDRTGRPLVLMPSQEYTLQTDEDVGALIAFLKTIPPVDRENPPIKVGPIIRASILAGSVKLAAEVIDHTSSRVASLTPAPTADYGRYLSIACIGCHQENFAGGKIPGAPPDWPASANLTSHPASAVAKWTEENFIAAIRTQKRPDGSAINPVMPASFSHMNDTELKALWAYLKTVAPVEPAKK